MKRGDVILADFPFFDRPGFKRRPALVVQSDVYNGKLVTTIVAMISGQLKHASDPALCLIDPKTPEGASSGLNGPSVVKGTNLLTIAQADVIKVIGKLTAQLMLKVDECLKSALKLA
jgi:mRNA-degrading endonuclease toxin of MazEF toxin-antitoxin module